MQFLFQLDLNSREMNASTDQFWELRTGPQAQPTVPKTRVFAEQIVAGVSAHLADIDARIQKYAANYQLNRIAAVDRNILRVAIYEMLHVEEVPPVVAINEAIEIAKKYGGEESGRFVNGILDRLRSELPRPAREATWRTGGR